MKSADVCWQRRKIWRAKNKNFFPQLWLSTSRSRSSSSEVHDLLQGCIEFPLFSERWIEFHSNILLARREPPEILNFCRIKTTFNFWDDEAHRNIYSSMIRLLPLQSTWWILITERLNFGVCLRISFSSHNNKHFDRLILFEMLNLIKLIVE